VSSWCQNMALVADKVSVALWNKAIASSKTAPSEYIVPCTGDRSFGCEENHRMDMDTYTSSTATKQNLSDQTTLLAVPEPETGKHDKSEGRRYPLPMRVRRPVMTAG
jgi:hypothetical protein